MFAPAYMGSLERAKPFERFQTWLSQVSSKARGALKSWDVKQKLRTLEGLRPIVFNPCTRDREHGAPGLSLRQWFNRKTSVTAGTGYIEKHLSRHERGSYRPPPFAKRMACAETTPLPSTTDKN